MKWQYLVVIMQAYLVLILTSCSSLPTFNSDETYAERKKREDLERKQSLAAYQKAGGQLSGLEAAGATVTTGVVSPQSSQIIGVTSEEDTVWAPEDPNVSMGEAFEQAWKSPESKQWHKNFATAAKLAQASGKPILLWFTNSLRSPQCSLLSKELMLKPDFERWAKDHVVRVTFDQADGVNGEGAHEGVSKEVAKAEYINQFRKRYNVHGNPSVYILSPDGKTIDKFRGYKQGDSIYYWGRLKHAVEIAERDYGAWREKMEKRGHRMWESRSGSKLFAKLYHFKDGRVVLIEPNGKRGVTSLSKLSDNDQAWIMLEKKKYDASRGR